MKNNATLGGNVPLTTETPFHLDKEGVQELKRSLHNTADTAVVYRDRTLYSCTLPTAFSNLTWYSSGWGQEFMLQKQSLSVPFFFQNTKGRCSGESAPFFTLSSDTDTIDFAICTSGNYRVEFIPGPMGITLIVSEPDEAFALTLKPGEYFELPALLACVYQDARHGYFVKHRWQQEQLLPASYYDELPVIYNHWWVYLDRYLNENVILENARIAREIGIEMLVLDSGWYGRDDLNEDSWDSRGDWDSTNRARFPHGLPWLKEQIEAMGLKFGIWVEIEAIGQNSRLLKEHPEYVATRDGRSLGYLCFGYPEVQEWAYETMKKVFAQCGSTYWKLDFNLDPGFGCTDESHGHGAGEGLYRHYEGFYRVLDRLRAEFPQLVIENCSSGGQRLNFEMGRHTHNHFLSDPDYSTHQLRIFKELTKWMMPKTLLHFMWSGSVSGNDESGFQKLNLNELTPEELRYHMRLAMMHPFGICHRLVDCREDTLALMKEHIDTYKSLIRPFISKGDFFSLYLSEHTDVFYFTLENRILVYLFAELPDDVSLDLSKTLSEQQLAALPQKAWMLTDIDSGEKELLSCAESFTVNFHAGGNWTHRLLLLSENK